MSAEHRRPHYESIASEQISTLRQVYGWSQSELARRMVEAGWPNYTQMTVSRTEKGERPIRLDELMSYAEVFEKPVAELWLSGDEHAWQGTTSRLSKAGDALMLALREYAEELRQLAFIADDLSSRNELPEPRSERVSDALENQGPEFWFQLSRVEQREDRDSWDEQQRAAGIDPDQSVLRKVGGAFTARWRELYVATPEEAARFRKEHGGEEGGDDAASPA